MDELVQFIYIIVTTMEIYKYKSITQIKMFYLVRSCFLITRVTKETVFFFERIYQKSTESQYNKRVVTETE